MPLGGTEAQRRAADFVFKFFKEYYKIDFGRTRPDDSLATELRFPKSLWRDWELDFAEDFARIYGVDLFRSKHFLKADTARALVTSLASELEHASSSGNDTRF